MSQLLMNNVNLNQSSFLHLIDKVWPDKEIQGNEILVYCPYCASDKRKCSINTNKRVFKCWICGEHGNLPTLINYLKELNYITAADVEVVLNSSMLKRGLSSNILPLTVQKQKKDILWTDKKPCVFPDYVLPLLDWSDNGIEGKFKKRALNYLSGRGFNKEDIIEAHIRFCIRFGSQFHGYVFFPILDKFGSQLLFWTTRTVIGSTPKSLHSGERYSKYQARDILFNRHLIRTNNPVAICEGPFDAWTVTKHIMPAVALLGKVMHPYQKLIMDMEKPSEIFVCLDKDAVKEAEKIRDHLENLVITVKVVQLEEKDPNETKPKDLKRLFFS
jgi:DNA primase